jgi:hypothetical protein
MPTGHSLAPPADVPDRQREQVDLAAIRSWCVIDGTTDRLEAVLAALPAE